VDSSRPPLLVLCDTARPGRENMAIDRAALAAAEDGGLSSAFLRIYAWDPPAVSLGYHQREEVLDLPALRRDGIEVVRRPTGGAAVLHWQEWTYAVAGPRPLEGLGEGFAQIYTSLAAALVSALRALGVPAESGGRGGPDTFACFEAVEGHEITAGGRKLVGSAFRQTRRAFLQHGSLLRDDAHVALASYLAGADEPRRDAHRERLRRRTTDLARLGRDGIEARDFAQALGGALAEAMGVSLRWIDRLPEGVLRHRQKGMGIAP